MRRRARTRRRTARTGSRTASRGSSPAPPPRVETNTGPATARDRARTGARRATSDRASGGGRRAPPRRVRARRRTERPCAHGRPQATSPLLPRRRRGRRRALRSARGVEQDVEVGELARLVPPCGADRTARLDEERRTFRDACETAELVRDVEGPHRLAVPVREEREVQVERLRPGDVRPWGIARRAVHAHTRFVELFAPVTQELHLVRSGGRPIEEVEEEERAAVAGELRDRALLSRPRPDTCVAYLLPCPDHRADVTGTPSVPSDVQAETPTRGAAMRRLVLTLLSLAALAAVPSAQA